MSRTIEFFYEFASTYSYLSVLRIGELARDRGVEIAWRPFLLGPIFKSQGWSTSPFNLYPAKGRYMVRDIERTAAQRGLAFVMPKTFPANGLLAARLAAAGLDEGWTARFTREVFAAQFGEGHDIADEGLLRACLERCGVDASAALALAQTGLVKERVRASTERAQDIGIFGAPSFVTEDGEIFWGDDRLEQALSWAAAET